MYRQGSAALFVLLGALILGGAVWGYFSAVRPSAPAAPEVQVASAPPSPTAGWSTFTNETIGFALKYPSQWRPGQGTDRNFNFEGNVSSTEKEIAEGSATSSARTIFFVQVRTRKSALTLEDLAKNLEDYCTSFCPQAEAILGEEGHRWLLARIGSETEVLQARFLRGREEFLLQLLPQGGRPLFPGQEMKDDELLALLAENFILGEAKPDTVYVSPDFGFEFYLPRGAQGQEYLTEEDGGSGLRGGTIFTLPEKDDARSYVHVALYASTTDRAAQAGVSAREAGLTKATTTVHGREVEVFHGVHAAVSGAGWPYVEALIPEPPYLFDVVVSNVASDPGDPEVRRYLDSLRMP